MAEETMELITQAQQGDTAAMQSLIESNLGLVVSIVKRYLGYGVPYEDLVQEGQIGFIHAVHNFDPKKKVQLTTYATFWIRQTVHRAAVYKNRVITVPENKQKERNGLLKEIRALEQKLDREATTEEIVEYTGYSWNKVTELLTIANADMSLDTAFGDDEDTTLLDILVTEGSIEDDIVRGELEGPIGRAIEQLPVRQRIVIEMRYGFGRYEPMALKEVADALGMSREAVRQREIAALKNLKRALHNYA